MPYVRLPAAAEAGMAEPFDTSLSRTPPSGTTLRRPLIAYIAPYADTVNTTIAASVCSYTIATATPVGPRPYGHPQFSIIMANGIKDFKIQFTISRRTTSCLCAENITPSFRQNDFI